MLACFWTILYFKLRPEKREDLEFLFCVLYQSMALFYSLRRQLVATAFKKCNCIILPIMHVLSIIDLLSTEIFFNTCFMPLLALPVTDNVTYVSRVCWLGIVPILWPILWIFDPTPLSAPHSAEQVWSKTDFVKAWYLETPSPWTVPVVCHVPLCMRIPLKITKQSYP